MPSMTIRESLACQAINVFAHRLYLRTDAERQAMREYRAREAAVRAAQVPA